MNGQSMENRRKVGIYAVVCMGNRRAYIGGSTNVDNRMRAHKHSLSAGKYGKNKQIGFREMQADYDAHDGAFEFKVLELMTWTDNRDEILAKETEWIKKYAEDGYEMYNYFYNTKTTMVPFRKYEGGRPCPEKYSELVKRVIHALDREFITVDDLSVALERMGA